MESIAEGFWKLADLLPEIEVKTRLRIVALLLEHTENVTHAKAHLERLQLLLNQIPTCFELKSRAHSLLSRCYQLLGTIAFIKQTLKKRIGASYEREGWVSGALRLLESGSRLAAAMNQPQLDMVFAIARLHIQMMPWVGPPIIERSLVLCDQLFEKILQHLKKFLYNFFCLLRACEYKELLDRVTDLDTTLRQLRQALPLQQPVMDPIVYQELQNLLELLIKELKLPGALPQQTADLHYHFGSIQQQLVQYEQLKYFVATPQGDPNKLLWAVLVMVDLMVVCSRPKGTFKDCITRINSELDRVIGEMEKLGITNQGTEAYLPHWVIWTGGVYLLFLTQLLENKPVIELTEADYVEVQKRSFSMMLQGNESSIQVIQVHYVHSLGYFHELTLQFLTQFEGLRATCQMNAAVSYICLDDQVSSSHVR
uniref:Uncharacterized protein n=1 Tax=Physcomitrium patens TaxID=3218 RepID=A0A7I4D844_PHYPA